MKKEIIGGLYEGERALYNIHNVYLENVTFDNGESPLKECSELELNGCIFKWKYPLWYCNNVVLNETTFIDMSRSGIWYTNNITINNSLIAAPKEFRRSSKIKLNNVNIPNAQETLWNCDDIELNDVNAKGDYFAMNSSNIKIKNFNLENIKIKNFNLDGNYAFDGAENIEIRNAVMNSKDSFWNCENVTVYDSIIIGEYLGWNSKNIKFVNCTIDSEQGMCYIDNIEMINCKLLNTNLAFERCNDVNAEIKTKIDSVKNPYSGKIKALKIDEIILDEDIVDPKKTTIEVKE